MKLSKIIENSQEANFKADEVLKEYLKKEYFHDLYEVAQQPDEARQEFEVKFLKLHTLALKKIDPSDNIVHQDIDVYFGDIEKQIMTMTTIRKTLVELVETEKGVNQRAQTVHAALLQHKELEESDFNKKMIECYGKIASTGEESLPDNIDLNSLEGSITFVNQLNRLYTSAPIVNRFTSFAHITVNYLLFDDNIKKLLQKNKPNLSPQNLEALTLYLPTPIQRLTRLVMLFQSLQKADTAKLFDPSSTSLLRKLLRVCKAINQLQKISEFEVQNMVKKKNKSPVHSLLKLIDDTFISPEVTTDNILTAVSNNLLLSVIPQSSDKEVGFGNVIQQQDITQSNDENQLENSLLDEALHDEDKKESDIDVGQKFYQDLEKIELGLMNTPRSSAQASIRKQFQSNTKTTSVDQQNKENENTSQSKNLFTRLAQQRKSVAPVAPSLPVVDSSNSIPEAVRPLPPLPVVESAPVAPSLSVVDSSNSIPEAGIIAIPTARQSNELKQPVSSQDWVSLNKNLLSLYMLNNARLPRKFTICLNLTRSYKALPDAIKSMPETNRIELHSAANKMLFILTSDTSKEHKIDAVANFEITAKTLLQISNHKKIVKNIVVGFIVAAFSAAIGAIVGAGIGLLAGAWTGPGAAVTGMLGLFAGAATGWSVGVSVGAIGTGLIAGGLTTYGLFKPNNPTRALCRHAKEFAEFQEKENDSMVEKISENTTPTY